MISRKEFSRNFIRWARRFSRGVSGAPFDLEGLRQFKAFESRGITPDYQNPYFQRLCGGRSMFNALQKQIRESYLTPEWQGYAADQESMPAWLFRVLYAWHPVVRGN